MDSSSASFIPKSPVKGTVNRRRVRKVYIFTYLIYVFFVGTLIASGVTWFYQYSMEQKLEATKVALAEERSSFSQSDLVRVNDVNARMLEVRRILDQQVSLNTVFKAIEETTLRSIELSGFSYERAEDSALTIGIIAEAQDFNATLFQRQVLGGNPVLAQAKLSEVTYTAADVDSPAAGGSVTFTLTTPVTPALTAYKPTTAAPTGATFTLPVPNDTVSVPETTEVSEATVTPGLDQ